MRKLHEKSQIASFQPFRRTLVVGGLMTVLLAGSAVGSDGPGDDETLIRELLGIETFALKRAEPAHWPPGLSRQQGRAAAELPSDQYRVLSQSYDKVGFIAHILARADGRITSAVIGITGMMGLAQYDVLIPWQELRLFQRDNEKYVAVVLRTRAQLEALPRYTGPRST